MKRARSEPLQQQQKQQIVLPKWQDALAGALAGSVSKTAMAPVERVKLLMQLESASMKTSVATLPTNSSSQEKNKTAVQVAQHVYQEEGILAFWRGNWPNVLRTAGQTALNFMLMDYYKTVAMSPFFQNVIWYLPSFNNQQQHHQHQKPPAESQEFRRWQKLIVGFVAGGLAGGTATTVLYPVEFMRTRLAMDHGRTPETRQYRGMRDVTVQILQADGLRGLYQGYGIALWGSVLYRLLFLGGYDALKSEWQLYSNRHHLHNSNNVDGGSITTTTSLAERFVLAQTVSLAAGTICYPIDSVRRRLMMQAGQPVDHRRYRGSIHCFRTVWAHEGLRGFYLGLGPNLVRSLGGALMLVAYDALKPMIRRS